MNLNDLKFETVIKEDSFQRVGTGLISATKETIIWIQIPTYQMSAASKHLVSDHLYNVIDTFDADDSFYIIMKNVNGKPINDYIKDVHLNYDARIHLCYELLKSLIKYDAFHYTYQLQLITDDQIVVNNDIVMFREIINYALNNQHDFKEVITRIGYIFANILKSKNDIHVQFTDNLIIGHHDYENLADLLSDFKDIFIYEKPSAISKMPREYNIIITTDEDNNISAISHQAENHQPLAENMNTLSKIVPKETPQASATFESPLNRKVKEKSLDDLLDQANSFESSQETDIGSNDLISPTQKEDVVTGREKTPEEKPEEKPEEIQEEIQEEIESKVEAKVEVKPEADSVTEEITNPEVDVDTAKVPIEADAQPKEDEAPIEDVPDERSYADYLKAIQVSEDDNHAPSSIKSADTSEASSSQASSNEAMSSQEALDPEDDLMESEKILDQLYGLEDDESSKAPSFKKWLFPSIAIISLVIIIAVGLKVFVFKPDVFEASYKIDHLDNEQIAFINTSESSRKIAACEWDVYYNDEFVQSFITHNFYPVFSTEGKYTIVLKISDEEGNWSDDYSVTYDFDPETNELEAQ